MPPHVFVDFVVFPPGHGRSVTNFWCRDAHEAQLRFPVDVSGDIGGCSNVSTRHHCATSKKPIFFSKTSPVKTLNLTFKVYVWQINPLMMKVTLNYTSMFSCSFAVNPPVLSYIIRYLNSAWGNNRWLLIRTKHKCTLWEFLNVNSEGKLK